MLLCAIEKIEPGSVVAAPVVHPRRRDVELLSPGAELDQRLLKRLGELEIPRIWIRNEATADLDRMIDANMGRGHREVYERLKHDFASLSARTTTTGDLQSYRQVVMDLICELISNRGYAGLTELLNDGSTDFFDHCASVAYISVLAGLELETYLLQERPKLSSENASDVTHLGIGAMLHDIGKLVAEGPSIDQSELAWARREGPMTDEQAEAWRAYRQHTIDGYRLLRQCQAPATVSQIVLNHHQRFDGTGFPDMAELTEGKQRGPQSGARIHVFTRIVSVANTLNHLMQNEQGKSRPPVAALAALGDASFDGWFDPVVADTVRRKLPPFAIGSHVRLSDGRQAAVIAPSVEQPCRPTVRLLDESERWDQGALPALDLLQHPELHIAECAGQNVEPYLFEMPEQKPRVLSALAGSIRG